MSNRSDGIRSISNNILWLFTDKSLKVVSEIIIGAWIARYLGPDEFGLLNYAIAFVIIFSALAKFGVTNVLVRDLVASPNNRRYALGSAFVLRVCTTVLSLIIFIIIASIIHANEYRTFLILIIVSMSMISTSFETVDSYFQSEVKSKYMVLTKNTVLLIFVFIKIWLILYNKPLEYFALAYSLEFISYGIALTLVYHRNFESVFKWRFQRKIAVRLIIDSWPLMVSGLFISIYMRIDQVMLLYMANEKAVGIYSAAIKISEAWNFIPVIITMSIFPFIVKAKGNQEVYKKTLRALYLVMIVSSGIIVLFILSFAGIIIDLLFGSDYIDSASISRIHILGAPFGFLGVATSQYLVSENLTKISLYRTLAGVIINITLNFILIPIYAEVGAALATVFSYGIVVFSLLLFKQTRGQFSLILQAVGLRS